jgi:uncharacterized RDD family membrane protein YckC
MTNHNTAAQPSLLRRFAVINYDGLLLMAVSIGYGLIYLAIGKLVFHMNVDRPAGIVFQLGWLLSIVGFFCYFWMRGGQTTGMRAWRVQITNGNGNAPTIGQCLLRFILAPLGWLLFFTFWLNPNRQMLHDQWSNTRLILLPKS